MHVCHCTPADTDRGTLLSRVRLPLSATSFRIAHLLFQPPRLPNKGPDQGLSFNTRSSSQSPILSHRLSCQSSRVMWCPSYSTIRNIPRNPPVKTHRECRIKDPAPVKRTRIAGAGWPDKGTSNGSLYCDTNHAGRSLGRDAGGLEWGSSGGARRES